MNNIRHNTTPVEKRRLRVRSKIKATADRPRLTVFRSNKYLYLQVLDNKGNVLAVSNELMLNKSGSELKGNKTKKSEQIAEDLAKKLKKKNIKKLIFDRGSYKYQGRVAAIADTLRKVGIDI
ncbi:MAG: 50S ribosomal protein L18 [Patescibacteria group bacterium]